MEPWENKTDDTRTTDTLPTFFICCEDQASEYVYLRYFETPLIKINLIGGQKSKMANVINAVMHCLDEKVMKYVDGVPTLAGTDIEVWCVFDRDVEDNTANRVKSNTEFDLAISIALDRGLKVAWSNDAFELWVLLHFEDLDPANPACANRQHYYDRLTDIFRTLPSPGPDLAKALAYNHFSYKDSLKREVNFRTIVRPELLHRTHKAIERAQALARHHGTALPFHQRAPCTLIYELIGELLRVGKKKLV
jgi:hypothetical protein